jgi:hypothetical protein
LLTTAGHLKGMYFTLNIPGNQLETHFRYDNCTCIIQGVSVNRVILKTS